MIMMDGVLGLSYFCRYVYLLRSKIISKMHWGLFPTPKYKLFDFNLFIFFFHILWVSHLSG